MARGRGFASAGARLALFLLWSAAIAALWLLRRPCIPRPGRTVAAARFSRWWSLGALRLLEIRVTTHGPLPSRPFFLVTNHLGYLDIAVIASLVPCTFVSKAEVARWPVFGTLASLAGTLYVDRKSKRDAGRVSRLIPDHFAAGGSLVVFAEATSTAGFAVAPFRSPLLEFPAASGLPVHTAALRYLAPAGFPPASSSMCWWGAGDFLPHFLNLFRMRGMAAEIAFSTAPVSAPDRKTLALDLHTAVSQRLEYLKERDCRPEPAMARRERTGVPDPLPVPAREAMA